MEQTVNRRDNLIQESIVTSQIALARLTIGLLQGLILYFLYQAVKNNVWPATAGHLFAPVLLISVIAPVLLISSLGHMGKRQVYIWIAAAVVIIGALGFYDIWRGSPGNYWPLDQGDAARPRFPSALLVFFTVAGFYIAHSLVLAGVIDRKRIAVYSTHFEVAWKLLIQIEFSALFVGVLWLVLWLGAALFALVKLNFLKDLLQEPWFVIPVTAFAFSCAIHITDVRPAIVRGIRTLLLVLLSWILPIATLIVAGFLLSLLWTGLAPLWATKHATSVLLGAAAVLIVLINAAFQNGEVASRVARVIRVSARGAALFLLPITAIAIYSLGLRVNEYGWTADRIIAAACLVIATCYALGYAWAACRKSGWLEPVAIVNIATAFVILVVLFSLFSPIADPARLSVNDQMARLAAGKVGADKFDFAYLRFEGARYGMTALNELKNRSQGTDATLIREKAVAALKKDYQRGTDQPKSVDLASTINIWPKTAHLPSSFLQEHWNDLGRNWGLPLCLTSETAVCDAYLIDFSGDGKPEILLVGSERHIGAALMMENENGRWENVGTLPNDFAGCKALREKLQAGAFQLLVPRVKDLEIAGQRIEVANKNAISSVACTEG